MNWFTYPEVPRRVVTGIREGKAVVVEDGPVPNAHHYTAIPGMMTSVLYASPMPPRLGGGWAETAPPGLRVLPEPGESRLMIVSFPPDSTMVRPEFNPAAADSEQRQFVPGLAEQFEVSEPGMHRTDTLDYGILLEGVLWLELDDAVSTQLHAGDVVIQRGTRHAWRNRGDHTATMCFVLIGAVAG
jgi:hypothetical protein